MHVPPLTKKLSLRFKAFLCVHQNYKIILDLVLEKNSRCHLVENVAADTDIQRLVRGCPMHLLENLLINTVKLNWAFAQFKGNRS